MPGDWQVFLDAVDAAYRHSDEEQSQLEQSLATLASLLHRERARSSVARESRAERRDSRKRTARLIARVRGQSGVAFLKTDANLVVTQANAAATALCGVDAPLGKSVFSILQPTDLEALATSWRSRLARAEPLLQTLQCKASDGKQLTCDWICLPRLNRRDHHQTFFQFSF